MERNCGDCWSLSSLNSSDENLVIMADIKYEMNSCRQGFERQN